MRDNVYCLMVVQVGLTDFMADVLFDTACAMMRSGSRQKRINEDYIEGKITTEFKEQSLGSVSGTEFNADVETELGKGKVKFLVREADAEVRNKLTWQGFASVDEMMADINSPPSRRVPMNN
jgi:hypothetical protein